VRDAVTGERIEAGTELALDAWAARAFTTERTGLS
jgi:hypothetical protein